MKITKRFLLTSAAASTMLLAPVVTQAQQAPENPAPITSTAQKPAFKISARPRVPVVPKLDATGYQDATGVIALFLDPRFVIGSIRVHDGIRDTRIMGQDADPYFAAQALLAAKKAGFDISDVFGRWIEQQLNRQEVDGSFDRFWRTPQTGNQWVRKQDADADDSTSALMMQLLYTMAPPSGLPVTWQIAFDRAEQLLNSLQQGNGLYIAKHDYPVSFLMDNCEIYGAFRDLETEMRARNQHDKANLYKAKADALKQSILTHLTNRNARGEIESFKVAAAPYDNDFSPNELYPGKMAQLFPYMFGIIDDPVAAKKHYKAWIKENLAELLANPLEVYQSVKGPRKTRIFGKNDFPHLMIANYALDMDDRITARKILKKALEKLRTNNFHFGEYAFAQIIANRLKIPAPRIDTSPNAFQAPAVQNLRYNPQPN